jgi:hypothetical protein
MQKADIFPNRRTVSQTGKIIPANSKPTGLTPDSHRSLNTVLQTGTVIPAKVNKANSKVNKTKIQSARGFHLRRQMASCVLVLPKPFRSTETTCPIASGKWGKTPPKLVFFERVFDYQAFGNYLFTVKIQRI